MGRKINKQKESSDSCVSYRATKEELQAIDESERSGIASDEEVEAAFRTFRRAG